MRHVRNIALVEDHPLTRAGVRMALLPVYHISIETGMATEFLERVEKEPVELVILDIYLPDMNGVETARRIKESYPGIKILIYSVDTNTDVVRQLLDIGVEGFLSKKSTEQTIMHAVTTVIDGGHFYLEDEEKLERDILISQAPKPEIYLTDREREILMGCCKGMTSYELADALCISQRTVENHKLHIFRKCGINNTVEMLLYALNNGIISL